MLAPPRRNSRGSKSRSSSRSSKVSNGSKSPRTPSSKGSDSDKCEQENLNDEQIHDNGSPDEESKLRPPAFRLQ